MGVLCVRMERAVMALNKECKGFPSWLCLQGRVMLQLGYCNVSATSAAEQLSFKRFQLTYINKDIGKHFKDFG